MKIVKSAVFACVFNLAAIPAVLADSHLSKAEVKAQAVEMCVTEAEKRYGENAIVYKDEQARIERDPSRAKWNKSLQGAMVKMKIKPQSKRTSKYSCLVKTDRTITFFKS